MLPPPRLSAAGRIARVFLRRPVLLLLRLFLAGETDRGRAAVPEIKFLYRKTSRFPALLLALALFVDVCSAGAESGLTARLVNKRPLDEAGPVGFYLGQVEVTLPDGTKKLLPHWTYLEPQVAKDRVIFFATEGLKITRIFFYDPVTEKERSHRLPYDMDPVFASPSFSPDGNKLAYYVPKAQRVIVRHWPSLKLLRKSEKFPVRPTDVPPVPPVWTGPTKVQFDPLFFLPERQVSFSFP